LTDYVVQGHSSEVDTYSAVNKIMLKSEPVVHYNVPRSLVSV